MLYERCPGCFAEFELSDTDITHPYIGASAACWKMYGDILVKEYSDPAYFKVHRVTVDAYGAQHIGDQADRRARQSAWIHLIALYLTFEKKESPEAVLEYLRKTTRIKRDYPPQHQCDFTDLSQGQKRLTVQDIIKADSPEFHTQLVMDWGESVLMAYKKSFAEIEKIYGALN